MNKISFLAKTINNFFNNKADSLSIFSGFIKRKRKLKGSSFIKAMVLGNISNANCSIERMCQMLSEESLDITKQGLDFRFTEEAVKFMELMYQKALALFQARLQLEYKILEKFNSVKLLDSTYINLPNSMEELYKGYGSYKDRDSNTKSGIKIQVVLDYLNQRLDRIDLKEGVKADQGYRDQLKDIKSNDLLIADLGCFVPGSFKEIDKAGAYFISRYKSDTNIYDTETGAKIGIIEHLRDRNFKKGSPLRQRGSS